MKRNNLTTLFLIAYFLIIISCISCYQILQESADTSLLSNDNYGREKRQLENLDDDDDDYAPRTGQRAEDPGFWDRVVKIALGLFNRLIEWLNS